MTNILTGLVALALVLGSAAAQQESQKILAPGEAPETVQQTIKAVLNTLEEHRGDCKITQVTMKTKKDGTILYEAHGIMTDGRKLTIQVAGDGKFIKVENDEDDHTARKKE